MQLWLGPCLRGAMEWEKQLHARCDEMHVKSFILGKGPRRHCNDGGVVPRAGERARMCNLVLICDRTREWILIRLGVNEDRWRLATTHDRTHEFRSSQRIHARWKGQSQERTSSPMSFWRCPSRATCSRIRGHARAIVWPVHTASQLQSWTIYENKDECIIISNFYNR